MKVEQACRFRTVEGYGITARTNGFDKTQEKLLAEVFNDSMSPVFSKLGTSILSCAVRESYAFYSRNTLRTHETREAIFTHSYILPADAYAEMMQEMPQRLLAVPASALMDIQSCGEELEQVEFPGTEYGELSLQEIIAKYQLTPERYSRLLMGAYEAMTSNRSLRLCTNVAIEDCERVVRELTYCIVDGLLPVMKGNVTFSSGADTRMNISILQSGEAVKGGELVFGVEDDSLTNIRYRDDLSAVCFQTLGGADREQRREMLQKMQGELCEMTDIEDSLTLLLICISFINCNPDKLNHDLSLSLFRSIAKAAGKSLSIKIANGLLTGLVGHMIEKNMISTKVLSNIAEWYLMDSSEEFRRQADQALERAPEAVCVALIDAVIAMPANDHARELTITLTRRISADSPELTKGTKDQLIFWIIRENVNELVDFRDSVIKSYTAAQMTALAVQILSSAKDRRLNGAEMEIVRSALAGMTRDACFTQENYAQLDTHLGEFTEGAMKTLVENCLRVRIDQYSGLSEQVKLLLKLSKENPEFQTELTKIMQAGALTGNDALLWETYQTEVVFAPGVTGIDVYELCIKYNTFKNMSGPFERKAMKLWTGYAKGMLTSAFIGEDGLRHADETAITLLKEAGRMTASNEMREVCKRFVANTFWELLDYDRIPTDALKISYEVSSIDVPNAAFKKPLVIAIGQILARPNQSENLVKTVKNSGLAEREQQRVQKLMYHIALRLMKQRRFVSWDLLLLYCWKSENEYDFDTLNNALFHIDGLMKEGKIRISANSAADSVLLRDPKLSKLVKKNISQETTLAIGLLNSLKGSGALGKKTPDAPSNERRKPDAPSNPGVRTAGSRGSRPGSNGIANPFGEEKQKEQPPEKKGLFGGLFGKRGK